MRETAGRISITIAAVLTAAYPIIGDWNEHHTFSPTWPAHAQFHGAAEIIATVMLAVLSLWLVWRPVKGDGKLGLFVAALLPLIHWVPFYFAAMIPGTSPINPPAQIFNTIGGIPVNQSFPILFAVAGYLLAMPKRENAADASAPGRFRSSLLK